MLKHCWIAVLLGLVWAGSVAATDPQVWGLPHLWRPWWNGGRVCPSVGCCPDDYCRKPMPCICPVPRCGSCDDYCRKPMPCLCPVPRCGSCDDYCHKPLPCLLCPPLTPYLQCGPDPGCSTCGRR
jgi:hypothetical protein